MRIGARAAVASVLVAVVLAGSSCAHGSLDGPIPANWKTYHGEGWSLRYPPDFSVEIYSRCSVVVFGGASADPIDRQPCSSYPRPPRVGWGRLGVAFVLLDSTRVSVDARAHETSPPLGPETLSYRREDYTYWDGLSNIPQSMDLGNRVVVIGGREYLLTATLDNPASANDRATLQRIIDSIKPSK
jgi:hypothetical protein